MEKLNEIKNNLNDIMMTNFIINEKEPEFLYHYTLLDSAKSIIESGQFWVSDTFKTNDKNEIIHTKAIMKDIIGKTVKYQIYKEWIFESFETICNLISKKAFILCFSIDKKSNKLWSEYAKNNGVCLRFKFQFITPNVFEEIINQSRFFENHKNEITKISALNLNHSVCYDKVIIRNRLKEYLELVYLCLKEIPVDNIENDPELITKYEKEFNLLNEIFTDIFLYSCISKEPKWKDEIEYRMLYYFENDEVLQNIKYQRKSFETNEIIDFLKINMKVNNTFSLDRIFVNGKKYIKEVRKNLKHLINNDTKIKSI